MCNQISYNTLTFCQVGADGHLSSVGGGEVPVLKLTCKEGKSNGKGTTRMWKTCVDVSVGCKTYRLSLLRIASSLYVHRRNGPDIYRFLQAPLSNSPDNIRNSRRRLNRSVEQKSRHWTSSMPMTFATGQARSCISCMFSKFSSLGTGMGVLAV